MFKTNVSERNSHKFEVIYYRGFISLKVRKPLHVANSFSINLTSIRPLNFTLCATKLYLAVVRVSRRIYHEDVAVLTSNLCTHIERKREKMKKRGLVQYAPEYILYSHALVRANIFCIILKKKK